MLTKIYYWFHRLISKPEERGEHSSGYWLDKIRRETLMLCRDIRGKILEIGCGEGFFLMQLAKQNPYLEIWGIDNDSTRLNNAEKESKEKNLKNMHFTLEDATNLSFDDEYFDVVICINVFYNMESIELVRKTLGQMKRVCKKSGRLIFDFRNSLNPLLVLKYRFARYYDGTVKVKNLPLNTYNPEQIESILKNLNLKIVNKKFIPHLFSESAGFIGFSLKRFVPIVIVEAEKRC